MHRLETHQMIGSRPWSSLLNSLKVDFVAHDRSDKPAFRRQSEEMSNENTEPGFWPPFGIDS
jgi:hypothetical protein